MKKSIATIWQYVLLSLLSYLLFLDFRKNNKDDLRELAQAGAIHAYTQFAIYQDNGDIRRYWDGVASFRTFQQAYLSMFQGQTVQVII